jgi:hypothetical protein
LLMFLFIVFNLFGFVSVSFSDVAFPRVLPPRKSLYPGLMANDFDNFDNLERRLIMLGDIFAA